MDDLEHAHALLRLSRRDRDALLAMAESPLCADAIFGFHAQQAIEKALKAWLCGLGQTYPLTHELGRLLANIAQAGVAIDDFTALEQYTFFAVQARYEEIDADDEPLDRPAVLVEDQQLLDHVALILAAPETRPPGVR